MNRAEWPLQNHASVRTASFLIGLLRDSRLSVYRGSRLEVPIETPRTSQKSLSTDDFSIYCTNNCSKYSIDETSGLETLKEDYE